MKKLIVLIGGVVFAAYTLSAATATVDGITWTYTVSNGKASLGGGSSLGPAIPTSTSGAITIPSTLGGYSVTTISSYAFSGCSGLTGVTISDGVTNIESTAFSYCLGLKSVTIPCNVTTMGESGEILFECKSQIAETGMKGWVCFYTNT